ncbi:hypothetical protein OCU04_011270 [Sclerotinia nivalis]|uniref:Uncharacterized protein n=1 Tax=Sclerotinia nivalis TaxID=352851 RepID=A0A9X0AB62_9HELO|nr:hypothetical protein OCU04_011270 [Sclerotinia nivalis]
MDDDCDKDTFLKAKLGTKQRIAQAKLRAAEKRALEIAARHAEAATTPSPSPLPASRFIRTSTPSISNHVPESIVLLRSPTTEIERVERTNSIKELSKKIDTAGNAKLQELITRMILRCPGAKEIAESFFVSNDVQSDDEEVVNRGRNHGARQENGEGQNVNHVTHTVDCATSTESNEGRIRGHTLGTQPNSHAQTHVPDQLIDDLNRRQEDDSSALHPASHPKHNSIFHNSDAPKQLDLQRQNNQSDSMQIEGSIENQAPFNIDGNSQKDNTATVQEESETALASRTTEKASSIPMNDALIENTSDIEISNALDVLPSNITKSRETSTYYTPSRATPQIPPPEVGENETDTGANEAPTTDITQLVNDISAKYINLARTFGPGKFPFDKLASIAAETSRHESAKEFSFESFNNLVDSVRKNIETMQRATANDVAPESMRTQSVREVSSDLGSPIPMNANGQELARNSVSKDGMNLVIQEAMVSAESTDSEEDEYVDLANIISSHYNCDSCRKPIVLPEGFIVSLENPVPTTCLHCKTRKASGITRRKLGARARSSISTEVPTSETDNQSPPDQVGHRGTENSETPNQLPRTVPDNLGSLSESFSEPFPEQSAEPLPESVPEVLEEPLISVEAEEKDSGGTSQDSGLGEGDDIKYEDREDTIIVEIPAWHSPTGPRVPASQIPANGQSLSNLGKRKVQKIEGEAVYSSPIGPKQRRGRPLKNYQVIILDSSPASSSSISTPASNQSTQGTPTVKKRGRPFGSKSRVKLETWEPNKPMEQTWEPNKPMEHTGETRPISQRMSANKSRKIIQNLFSQPQDFMEDSMQDETQHVTREVNPQPRRIRETPVITRSATGSMIPKSRAASRRHKPPRPITRPITIQRDSGSEHVPPQRSELRPGSASMARTMPDDNIASTSFSGTFSAEMNVEGPATEIPVSRGKQIERTGNLSFSGDQELPQSIVEQGPRMVGGSTTSTTIGDEHGNVDDRVTGSLEGDESGVEKEVGSIMRSMNDKIRTTFGEGSNFMKDPNEIGNESSISKERQDKVGDSSAENPIPAHTQPRPQMPMYLSNFPNIENQQPSPIAELVPTHTTTTPLIPNRSQSNTPYFNPKTFFTRSFGPDAMQPQTLPPPLPRRRSSQGFDPTTSFPRPLVPDASVPYPSPHPPPYRRRPSQGVDMAGYYTSPVVPNMAEPHTLPPASRHSSAFSRSFSSAPNSGFGNQN